MQDFVRMGQMNEDWPDVIPKTLHGLLRLAVHDARLCDLDPDYVLNMAVWHEPCTVLVEMDGKITEVVKCYVCLAGSVLAKTCHAPHDLYLWDPGTCSWMTAIDCLRRGDLYGALKYVVGVDERDRLFPIYREELQTVARFIKTQHGLDSIAPWSTYLEASDMLEALHHQHIKDQKRVRVWLNSEIA